MPTDVKLGDGYIGSIMEQRFPNQYRDSSREVQTGEQGYYQFPGAQSGHPRSVITDPDHGRAMKLVELPGIGQVSVPADSNIGQVVNVEQRMAGMGQVVNIEQRMAGIRYVNSYLPPVEYATKRLTEVAVSAANEGLKTIVSGRWSYAMWEKVVREYTEHEAMQLAQQWQWTAGKKQFVSTLQSILNAVIRNTIDAFSARAKATVKTIPQRGNPPAVSPLMPAVLPQMVAAVSPQSGTADWQGTMMGMGAMGDSSRASASAITAAQDAISLVIAGVNQIGAGVWDTVSAAIAKVGKMPDIAALHFPNFDKANDELIAATNNMFALESHWPTVDEVAAAMKLVGEFKAMVAYVKKVVPEKAAEVDAWQQEVAKRNSQLSPVTDPHVVGWEAFKKTLAERANALMSGLGIGLGTLALLGAGLLALFIMLRGGGQSAPASAPAPAAAAANDY